MFWAKLCENTEMFGVKQQKRCNNRCTACKIVKYVCVVCSFGKKECQNWFADSFIATVFGNLRQCVVQRRCSNRCLWRCMPSSCRKGLSVYICPIGKRLDIWQAEELPPTSKVFQKIQKCNYTKKQREGRLMRPSLLIVCDFGSLLLSSISRMPTILRLQPPNR